MNCSSFDALTRAVGAGVSRRTVLRSLLAGSVMTLTGGHSVVQARTEKEWLCKPSGPGSEKGLLKSVPAHLVDRRLESGYSWPYYCDDGPACVPCCTEVGLACSNDADCCSENCLESGVCGGPCYCYDRYDPDEHAELGSLCGGGTGGECNAAIDGCQSSADCTSESFPVCVQPANACNLSGGMCAIALTPCDD